jgi:hypothetical protein
MCKHGIHFNPRPSPVRDVVKEAVGLADRLRNCLEDYRTVCDFLVHCAECITDKALEDLQDETRAVGEAFIDFQPVFLNLYDNMTKKVALQEQEDLRKDAERAKKEHDNKDGTDEAKAAK